MSTVEQTVTEPVGQFVLKNINGELKEVPIVSLPKADDQSFDFDKHSLLLPDNALLLPDNGGSVFEETEIAKIGFSKEGKIMSIVFNVNAPAYPINGHALFKVKASAPTDNTSAPTDNTSAPIVNAPEHIIIFDEKISTLMKPKIKAEFKKYIENKSKARFETVHGYIKQIIEAVFKDLFNQIDFKFKNFLSGTHCDDMNVKTNHLFKTIKCTDEKHETYYNKIATEISTFSELLLYKKKELLKNISDIAGGVNTDRTGDLKMDEYVDTMLDINEIYKLYNEKIEDLENKSKSKDRPKTETSAATENSSGGRKSRRKKHRKSKATKSVRKRMKTHRRIRRR